MIKEFESWISTNLKSQKGKTVISIGEDKDGNIWFGTVDAGAWKFDGKKLTNFITKNGLTSMEIMEIYLDKKGVLWFGMGDGSVCQFNGESFDKIY